MPYKDISVQNSKKIRQSLIERGYKTCSGEQDLTALSVASSDSQTHKTQSQLQINRQLTLVVPLPSPLKAALPPSSPDTKSNFLSRQCLCCNLLFTCVIVLLSRFTTDFYFISLSQPRTAINNDFIHFINSNIYKYLDAS